MDQLPRGSYWESMARTWRWVRSIAARLTAAAPGSPAREYLRWDLERTRRHQTRWSCRGESVDCFRFDDGYVTTVTYDGRGVTWQLTPGPVMLGSALAAAALYVQHGVTPQIDRAGRMFIAVDNQGIPTQVFDEIADRPVDYVYLDGHRTVEEFPPFVDVTPDLERVFERMSPAEQRPLGDNP